MSAKKKKKKSINSLFTVPLTRLQGLWVVLRWLPLSSVAGPLQAFGQERRRGAECRRARGRRRRAGGGGEGIGRVRSPGGGMVARRLTTTGTQPRRRGRRLWRRGRVREGFGHVRGRRRRRGSRDGGGVFERRGVLVVFPL